MAKGRATRLEREFMAAVSLLPCCVSGFAGVHVHHITDCGSRLGNWWVLPLHPEYHTGKYGFSGTKRDAWDKSLPNQFKLCLETYEKLGLEMPIPQSKIPGYYERIIENAKSLKQEQV